MSTPRVTPQRPSNDELTESIADQTRRETLVALHTRTDPVPTKELATLVAAEVTDTDLVDITREDRQPVYVKLVHNHLPKLVEADLVARDTEAGTVTTTDHPVWDEEWFQQLLTAEADDWDFILSALQSSQRRIALAILEDADALEREELARRGVAHETDVAPAEVSEQAVEEMVVRFHHVHIPALQQAGLIVYDDETARYAGHPGLKLEWLDGQPTEQSKSTSLSGDESDIWTIEGRENVIARGQELLQPGR